MSASAVSTTSRKPFGAYVRRWLGWAGIGLLLFTVVYPMFWIFVGSFKTQAAFLSDPFWSLPPPWNFDNYISAFVDGGLGTYIRNSVIAVFPSLFLILLFGTAAAFALQVLVWQGRSLVLSICRD